MGGVLVDSKFASVGMGGVLTTAVSVLVLAVFWLIAGLLVSVLAASVLTTTMSVMVRLVALGV